MASLIAVCVALIISSVLGYRAAVSTRINEDSHHHEHITGLREGLFVLLGFLLGFTVAIVLPRFDERKELVIDEANAIGTTALRAETLPEPQRDRTLELLREYVAVRRGFQGNTSRPGGSGSRDATDKDSSGPTLATDRCRHAAEQTAVVAVYLQALNEMIDVSEKRLAAFENRVPKTVWLIIFIVAIFQSFVTGFSLKRRLWFSLVMTPIVIAVVMALLADLDSPRTGLIRIEQNSMERLVRDMTDAKQ